MSYSWGDPDEKLVKNGKVMCPKCGKEQAVVDPTYGVLPGNRCKARSEADRVKYGSLGGLPEFVPQNIKEDRKKYFNSLVQPYRGDTPSKEFVEANPAQAKQIFGDDINKATYVWRDLPGWSTRDKTQ